MKIYVIVRKDTQTELWKWLLETVYNPCQRDLRRVSGIDEVHATFLHVNTYINPLVGVWKLLFQNIEIVPSAQVQVVGVNS
jgi:hypothetical protein